MGKSTQMGRNRTGIDMSPIHSKEMIDNVESAPPSQEGKEGNGLAISSIERQYIQESDSVGSVPMPGSVKGALKSAMEKISGRNPEMLINKLGERLAYERSGVRLYQSLITKCENAKAGPQVPIDRLKHFQNEEEKHFQMVKKTMQSLGADPTAETPDADVSGVAAMGFQKVLCDPRTSVGQCLEAMLSIELTDYAGWELLIDLADKMGLDDSVKEFQRALKEEEDHLTHIRRWYSEAVLSEAGVEASRH